MAGRECPDCGTSMADDQLTCPDCGTNLARGLTGRSPASRLDTGADADEASNTDSHPSSSNGAGSDDTNTTEPTQSETGENTQQSTPWTGIISKISITLVIGGLVAAISWFIVPGLIAGTTNSSVSHAEVQETFGLLFVGAAAFAALYLSSDILQAKTPTVGRGVKRLLWGFLYGVFGLIAAGILTMLFQDPYSAYSATSPHVSTTVEGGQEMRWIVRTGGIIGFVYGATVGSVTTRLSDM